MLQSRLYLGSSIMKSHGREWQQGFRTENHNSTDTGVGEIRETKPCVNIGERGGGGDSGEHQVFKYKTGQLQSYQLLK